MEEVRIGIGRLTGKRVNPLEERAGLVFGGRGRLLGVLGGEFDLDAEATRGDGVLVLPQ